MPNEVVAAAVSLATNCGKSGELRQLVKSRGLCDQPVVIEISHTSYGSVKRLTNKYDIENSGGADSI
jgi:hypothetical protein